MEERYSSANSVHLSCGYEHCIDFTLNTPVDLYSIPLPEDILLPSPDSILPLPLAPLTVASTAISVDWEMASSILHPLYLGTEPIPPGQISGIHSIFGLRFGVPFRDVDSSMYGRPLCSAKLILCYFIPE